MSKSVTEFDETVDIAEEEDTDDADVTDVVADADTEEEDADELTYDEDGNIIVPDKGVDTDDDAEESDEEEIEAEDPEEAETPEDGADGAAERGGNTAESEEITELRRKYHALEAQSRDTLAKLGVKNDDVLDGLASVAAEADNVSLEEYKRRQAEQTRTETAQQLLRRQEFERLAAADLAELQAAYPETKTYKHLSELPEDIRGKFGRYRDLGLPAKDAYAAANPDGIRKSVAEAVKKQSLRESKRHLRTSVPKGSKDHSIVMSKAELSAWRDLFPGKSDKEIVALYKKTAK